MVGLIRYKLPHGGVLPLIWYCVSQTSLSAGEQDAVPSLVAANGPRHVHLRKYLRIYQHDPVVPTGGKVVRFVRSQ
jgi:hypothetical protein